jgi:Flp pilus assembly protein TadD
LDKHQELYELNSGARHPRVLSSLGLLSIVVAVALTLWAYAPALDAGFVFDDEPNITDSPAVHWDEFSWKNIELLLDSSLLPRRPVANLSFALDHLVWGLEPSGYHLTNLLIHLAVGGAIMWVCLLYASFAFRSRQRQAPRRVPSYLVLVPIGLFLLHPLNTQAVSYVVQRMASMAALFSLLAFASYLVARYKVTTRSYWWYFGAAMFCLLGLGSKENALLLFPVIALFEVCFFRSEWQQKIETVLGRKWSRQWTIVAWACAIILATLAMWMVMVSSDSVGLFPTFSGRDYSGLERMLTQTRVQFFYLSLLLWPSPDLLNLDHDFMVSRGLLDPPQTLLATVACLAFFWGVLFLCVRQPRYGFPLMAYLVFHAIEAGPVGLELVFEHRMYLPSTMLVLLGATFLVDANPRQQVVVLAAVLLLSFPLANWTHTRNEVWADPIALQADIARKSPNKARAQRHLALALREDGRFEEALAIVQRAIELGPTDDRHLRRLGDILLDLDQPMEALQAFESALSVKPASMAPVLGIGTALKASGQEEAAFRHYLDTGTKFAQGGLPWQAIPVLREAVALRAGNANARHALGSAYLMVERHNEAIEQFRAALQIDQAKSESWYNLGLAADALGLGEEAMHAYRAFVERAPSTLQQPIAQARERIVS